MSKVLFTCFWPFLPYYSYSQALEYQTFEDVYYYDSPLTIRTTCKPEMPHGYLYYP